LYSFLIILEGTEERGKCRGEYEEGNIIHCFLLLTAIASAPLSPVAIKATTNFSHSYNYPKRTKKTAPTEK